MQTKGKEKTISRGNKILKFRLATFDVFSLGKRKNNIAALLEFEETNAKPVY